MGIPDFLPPVMSGTYTEDLPGDSHSTETFLGFERDISASSSQLNNPKGLVHLCLRDQISLSNFLGILLGCLGVSVM